MVKLANKYISEAVYVVTFERDLEIRFKQAQAEKIFKAQFPAQSTQTNFPDDADQNLPRLIFDTPRKQLIISQVTAQLTLKFTRDEMSIRQQLDVIGKNVINLHSSVVKFKENKGIKENALVVSVNYPSDETQATMHEYMFQRFFRINPLAELASLSFALGFKTQDKFFVNLAANVYEIRKVDLPQHVFSISSQQIAKIPIIEKGYGVKVDINNRPMVTESKSYADIGPTLTNEKISDFVLNQLDQIMGFSEETTR